MSLPELDDLVTATIVTTIVGLIVAWIARKITRWGTAVLDALQALPTLEGRVTRLERHAGLDDYVTRHTGGKPS